MMSKKGFILTFLGVCILIIIVIVVMSRRPTNQPTVDGQLPTTVEIIQESEGDK